MTFSGGFRALNRQGIASSSSPLLQMSFETTTAFLTASALYGFDDAMHSPSARMCVGQPIDVGSGCMDVRQPLVWETPVE
jgi:DNA-directed RNA polymerase I subunit RPA1